MRILNYKLLSFQALPTFYLPWLGTSSISIIAEISIYIYLMAHQKGVQVLILFHIKLYSFRPSLAQLLLSSSLWTSLSSSFRFRHLSYFGLTWCLVAVQHVLHLRQVHPVHGGEGASYLHLQRFRGCNYN